MSIVRNTSSVVVLAAAIVLALPGAAWAGDWVYLDLTEDGRYDSVAIDQNNDGAYDILYTDLDGDQVYDITMWDQNFDGVMEWIWVDDVGPKQVWGVDHNGDGYFEHVLIDSDGNGRWEAERFDADGDGYFEWQSVDRMYQDGWADTWTQIGTAAADQVSNDIMVQHIVTMNLLNVSGY